LDTSQGARGAVTGRAGWLWDDDQAERQSDGVAFLPFVPISSSADSGNAWTPSVPLLAPSCSAS
jgi:hypothetical protein